MKFITKSIKWEVKTRPIIGIHKEKKKKFIIKSINRELKTRPIYDCRCDERLEPKDNESTCLVYTGLLEELEYLKIETNISLIDEKFVSVMGECVI
jgi:hypothetical protein